jgi:hypothetical protein
MRYGCLAGMVVLATACAPVRENRTEPGPSRPRLSDHVAATVVPGGNEAAPLPVARPTDLVPMDPVKATRLEAAGVMFEGVAFDSRSQRLAVVDQAGGPGSEFADAQSAALARSGLAAANAGFFTPEGAPLGWVIAEGRKAGGWNSASSLGSGIWHQDAGGNVAISRRESLGRDRASSMRELLQAGPMLVENGRAVGGLEGAKSSVRTLLVWDGGSRWWLGRTSPCTLAACAAALSQSGPAGWKARHALNLDGGRSADLWISDQVRGGPLTRRAAWNRPVRNFLVLLDR